MIIIMIPKVNLKAHIMLNMDMKFQSWEGFEAYLDAIGMCGFGLG